MTGPLKGTQVGKADLVESRYDQEKGWEEMRTLTIIPKSRTEHERLGTADTPSSARTRLRRSLRRVVQGTTGRFTPLIDAKAASQLLGVPYTWLLAQARAGKIPHHRLGHYVRFDPDDLQAWLRETRSEPCAGRRRE